MNIETRLVNLMSSDIRPLRWTQGWVAILLALGFLFSVTDNTNYTLINSLTVKTVWGICFMVYGVLNLSSSLFDTKPLILYFSSITGFWLWSYIFLSFIVYDTTTTKSTEWMLVIPIIIEIWLCTNLIYKNRKQE